MKRERDIKKSISPKQFANTLRRIADKIEKGESFRIQIAGERIYVSKNAEISIEHERDEDHEEIEFQLQWKRK